MKFLHIVADKPNKKKFEKQTTFTLKYLYTFVGHVFAYFFFFVSLHSSVGVFFFSSYHHLNKLYFCIASFSVNADQTHWIHHFQLEYTFFFSSFECVRKIRDATEVTSKSVWKHVQTRIYLARFHEWLHFFLHIQRMLKVFMFTVHTSSTANLIYRRQL